MPGFNINIAPQDIKSVGIVPVDNNENPGNFDNTTSIDASTAGPITISTGAPLPGFNAHLVLQPLGSAAPGVYPVSCTFRAVAGGPLLTSQFTVTVPPQNATHLKFTEV